MSETDKERALHRLLDEALWLLSVAADQLDVAGIKAQSTRMAKAVDTIKRDMIRIRYGARGSEVAE